MSLSASYAICDDSTAVITWPETGYLRSSVLLPSFPNDSERAARDSFLCRRKMRWAITVIRLDAMMLPTIARASCVSVMVPPCEDVAMVVPCGSEPAVGPPFCAAASTAFEASDYRDDKLLSLIETGLYNFVRTCAREALSCALCIARFARTTALSAEACTLETTELADDEMLEAVLDAASTD